MIKTEVINERIYRALLNVMDEKCAGEIADNITAKVCEHLAEGLNEKQAIGKALLENIK